MKHGITNLDRDIGKRIKAVRQQAHVSQTALGKKLNVSFQQVQKYENGTNRVSASNLYRIAQITGASVQDFFPGPAHETSKARERFLAKVAALMPAHPF